MTLRKCKNCGKTDEHHAYGLCYKCYKKQWKPKEKRICVLCKKEKSHHAKGYCAYCYNKTFYKEYYRMASRKQYSGVTKEIFDKLDKRCVICGFDKIIETHHLTPRSKGGASNENNLIVLCPNHHKMLHNADYTEEMLKQIKEKLSSKNQQK